MKITHNEVELLKISTIDLLGRLKEESQSHHVKQKAFQFLLNGEEVQVQVLVTRHEDDFLEDFQTEIMNGY